jgi:hypothetical protein
LSVEKSGSSSDELRNAGKTRVRMSDPFPTVLWYDASVLKLVSPRLTSLTLLATSGMAVTVRREGLSENLETLIGTLSCEERREKREEGREEREAGKKEEREVSAFDGEQRGRTVRRT